MEPSKINYNTILLKIKKQIKSWRLDIFHKWAMLLAEDNG